jgi:hypothetical protein
MRTSWLLLSLFLLAPPAVADEFVFALPFGKGAEMEAVAALANGKYLRPPVSGDSESTKRYAAAMAKGKSYPAYFGGVPKGHVTVQSFDPDRFGSAVKTDFKQTDDVVVTTIAPPKRPACAPLTEAQKAQAWALAERLFNQGKVVLPKGKPPFSKILARDLDGDGNPEIIAYYFVPGKKVGPYPAAVMVFAHFNRHGQIKSDRTHFELVPGDDIIPGTPDVTPGFMTNMPYDTLDVDGDGKDEILTTRQTYEGTWYSIWHHDPDGWRDRYTTYRYRTAF